MPREIALKSETHGAADALDPLMDVKPMGPVHFYWYVHIQYGKFALSWLFLCFIVPKSYQTRSADQISVKILLMLSPFLTPNVSDASFLCAVTCYIRMVVIRLPCWKCKINNEAPPNSLLPYTSAGTPGFLMCSNASCYDSVRLCRKNCRFKFVFIHII